MTNPNILTLNSPAARPSCATCCHSTKPDGQISGLICCRYPPAGTLVNTNTGPIALPVWPPVSETTICGEFEPREEVTH